MTNANVEMAPFGPQALTPRKRQIETSLDKADTIIRSSSGGIHKNFYGNFKRARPRYSQDWQLKDRIAVKKIDVYEFDENGETPQESVFSHIIKPHEIGFPNSPGTNVCWMNATLQIILGMKCFIDDLENLMSGSIISRNHYSSILQAFLDVVRQHKRGRLLPVHKDLSALRTALATLDTAFACENQQDAPEFLIRLLDKFREDFSEVGNSEYNNNKESTPLKEIKLGNFNSPIMQSSLKKQRVNPICENLQFYMKESYCCLTCGVQNEKTQEHLALYVDIPIEKESSASISTALEQYMKIHKRELRCEKCEGEQCQVNTVFSQLPRILLVQVKRYTYLEYMTQKITNSIGIQLDLNVGHVVDKNVLLPKVVQTSSEKEICSEDEMNKENEKSENTTIHKDETDQEEEKENSPRFSYRLTGILSHYGDNPNTGHYVADVYHHVPQHWYHYDDENVQCLSEDEVHDETREQSGYLFVYTYRPLHDQLLSKPRSGS